MNKIKKVFVLMLTLSTLFLVGTSYINAATNDGYLNLSDYNYTIKNQNTITLNKYIGSDSNVVVKSKAFLNGKEYNIELNKYEVVQDFNTGQVTIIESTFQNLSNITSITIRQGVTFEDNDTSMFFSSCTNLQNINIENGITSIGSGMFQQTKINSFNVPNGVTSVYSGAFMNCANLETIYFPNSVTYFDYSLIMGSMNVESIIIDNNRLNVLFGELNNLPIGYIFNDTSMGGSSPTVTWLR